MLLAEVAWRASAALSLSTVRSSPIRSTRALALVDLLRARARQRSRRRSRRGRSGSLGAAAASPRFATRRAAARAVATSVARTTPECVTATDAATRPRPRGRYAESSDAEVRARRRLPSDRRSAGGDRSRSPRASTRGERYLTLLGATGTGKTMTMAATVEAVQKPALVIAHNKTLAAQLCNEFRTYFPAQRGRVLRLLLRLLPARGVRPEQGPLHREGLGDQPGDRPPAALGDGGAVRPARRADRRQRLVHLRPRIAADLRREPADAEQGRVHRPRRAAAKARLDPVHAQRHRAVARHVPGPRRDARDLPGVRRDRVPDRAVRRRGRAPAGVRSADRRGDRPTTSSTSGSGRPRTTTCARG